jgi:hypothetical protein
MDTTRLHANAGKEPVSSRRNHDGSDEPLPGRKPSQAFQTALNAVRVTPKKTKK